jgi:porin
MEKGSGRGVGVFGRFGVADGDPNIIKHFFSVGLAGKGLMASRLNDQFGLGWYYMGISNPKLSYTPKDQTVSVTPYGGSPGLSGSRRTLKLIRDENGFEIYYNFAVTPWAILTPDIQFIRPTQKKTPDGSSVESSTVLGIRLHLLL